MATVKENINYPMISTNAWWAIRKRFVQALPKNVTDSYLAGILGMEPISAKNMLPPLKKLGLIDNDGKPTDLAIRWRDDGQYPSVCEEIRMKVYPQELLDTFPDLSSSRSNVERWFANTAGVGVNASQKMASLYLLLTEADPTKQDGSPNVAKAAKPKTISSAIKSNRLAAKKGTTDKSNGKAHQSLEPEQIISSPTEQVSNIVPSLHIDVQIHIPPDASAEQIDHIFSSMAKHLYKGRNMNE